MNSDFSIDDILNGTPVEPSPLTVLDVIANQYPGMYYSLESDYAIHRGWGSMKRALERGELKADEKVRQTDLYAMKRAGGTRAYVPGWPS